MYLADLHTHTLYSQDSEAPLSEMVRAAQAAGLQELCTTDHCDFLQEDGTVLSDWDWAPVLKQYEDAKRSCSDPNFRLSLGIELGGAQTDPVRAQKLVSEAPLDFIIGSVHNLSPAAGGRDFYFLEYKTEADCFAALDDYFTSLLILSTLPCYHALGHIMYPLRYMNGRAGHHINLYRYQANLNQILRMVIQTGRAIEFNTHCGEEVALWRPILATYKQLGGELITIGSDAHRPEDVAKGVAVAQELLIQTGFRYHTVYRQGVPEQIKL